jgi:quinolinate synthase
MLRLQAPLPDDYTLDEDDLIAHRRRQGRARRTARDPRAPLPARRGDPLGRRRRGSFKLARFADNHRATDIVFCGVHFMAESADVLTADSTGDPARPERGLLDGRHG